MVPPAAQFADSVLAATSYPPSGAPPDFQVEEIDGVYRLTIGGAVFHYDPHRPGFGVPVPEGRTTSNRFVIRLAR